MGTNWIHLLLYFNMQRNTKLSIANFNVVNTSRSLPHSWPITGFLTRVTQQVPLVEQVFSGVRVTLSLVLYVCFVDRCLYFLLLSIVLFVFSGVLVTRSLVLYVCFVDRCLYFLLLSIVLFVLRFTYSDYPFGIFKLFFCLENHCTGHKHTVKCKLHMLMMLDRCYWWKGSKILK